jgi:hypothetical protein
MREEYKKIYGSIQEYGISISGYNHELYTFYNESNIVKVSKVRWMEHLFILYEKNPCRKLILLNDY